VPPAPGMIPRRISGWAERVRAEGGDVTAGPQPDGGFGVMARLPLPRRAGRAPVIRVVLADDQDLIRVGLRATLDAEEDIEVVAEAANSAAAASAAAVHQADVVLMDVQMPRVDGIAGTREVLRRRPGAAW
jgi:hypothetical protein